MNMSIALLRQTWFALHARLKMLNERWPEEFTEEITQTNAAIDIVNQELERNGLIVRTGSVTNSPKSTG